MDKNLLDCYMEELSFLREASIEFAKAQPKIAGYLKLNAQGASDPDIALLLESFAFLNARIHRKLADDFPEFTESVLNILYPHYQTSIPSMSIVQFHPAPDLTDVHTIPAGAALETNPSRGEIYRFQTCYDTTLLPITIESAEYMGHLLQAPKLDLPATHAITCLRLNLHCIDPSMSFANFKLDKLRFYLDGPSQHVFPLYELLFKHTTAIVIAKNYQDPNAIMLTPHSLQPIGFKVNEGLLPYSKQSMLGYRLLTEFFVFPEKFLFFDIMLQTIALQAIGPSLEIYFYFNKENKNLPHLIKKNIFALGCTPIINLFNQKIGPLPLTHTQHEYPIIPDYRKPDVYEIYSINKVRGINTNGEEIEYLPFYGMKHYHSNDHHTFWTTTRRPSYNQKTGITNTDMFLSLVDLNLNSKVNQDISILIDTTCLNREVPDEIAYDESSFALQFSSSSAPVTSIRLLKLPTPVRPAPITGGKRGAFISHLSLNHLSLTHPEEGIELLKEILQLYNFVNNDESLEIINSLISLQSKRIIRRISQQAISTFCQGLLMTLEIDESHFVGNSVFLFTTIIEHFFAIYCSLNSFIQLQVMNKGKKKEIYLGALRLGDKILI